MIAEQSAEMVFRFRREIDELIGLTNYVAEFGIPPTNEELDRRSATEHAASIGTSLHAVSSQVKTETVA